jgi:HEAT repeat protein
MRIPNDHPLRITHALLRPDTVLAAAESLRGHLGTAEVEGLMELIDRPESARAAVIAIGVLEGCDRPIVLDALAAALESPHPSVRAVAVQALHQRRTRYADAALVRVLEHDESWVVRRAALRALAEDPSPGRWRILSAADDPHWRVRHALIRVLLSWGETSEQRQEIDERLARLRQDARVQGLRDYLRHRWTGVRPGTERLRHVEDPRRFGPVWDWDVAVLLRNLERLGETGRRRALDSMPYLLGHADDRVRKLAADTLRNWGEVGHLLQALTWFDDLRHGAGATVKQLLAAVDLDRIEALARLVLHSPEATPAQRAWAVDQAGSMALPVEEEETMLLALVERASTQPVAVRCALARLLARWPHPQAEGWLRSWLQDEDPEVKREALQAFRQQGFQLEGDVLQCLLGSEAVLLRAEAVSAVVTQGGDRVLLAPVVKDPDVRVRLRLAECLVGQGGVGGDEMVAQLQKDPHPHVRAAALTPSRAAELIEDPTHETSWHVLAQAARQQRVPLWELEPEQPWRPSEETVTLPAELRPSWAAPLHPRVLGPEAWDVSPLGVSGHYGLPVEGFVRAVETGVNLLFWEPNYQNLTDFSARLNRSDRRSLYFVTGTFEAEGKRIQRDVERAVRKLKVERLAVFLLFWVQSWDRVTPDVGETLRRLKEKGLIGTFGLSTHSRPLAVEAMRTGWDPVMVRHSAAHRGAEEQVSPHAVALGKSILTFNNTCYGRLLTPQGDLPAPRPADCYRYTLAQPGVVACWSAPATIEQLEENLDALHDPELPRERWEHLRAVGDRVYQEDSIFTALVRSR